MSEKIILINLDTQTVKYIPYSYKNNRVYGRGLVLDLLKTYVPAGAGRNSSDNAIVIVPGFFVGNKAPSACRMFVATIESEEKGIQVCNTTGNMPQKLGSLGIAGIVIKGVAEDRGTIVHIDKDGVNFSVEPELNDIRISQLVSNLKSKFNNDSAIIGCGKAGDMRMSLSTFFCTYPDGDPEFHAPRSGFGDVWGSKKLRALVVDADSYFDRECVDSDNFWTLGKQLAQKVINDDVCGGALPSYGSITIMKVLKSKQSLAELPPIDRKKSLESDKFISDAKASKLTKSCSSCKRINKTCAPMCVIGCLNRHVSNNGEKYGSPAEVETQAAIENCFGIDDHKLAAQVQEYATEIGIVATEFVTACNTYAKSMGIEHGEEHLIEWLEEIEKGSLEGRVIASRTYGVSSLFGDVDLADWIDRKAIQDEGLFNVQMNSIYPRLSRLSDMDILYAQIFVLENLGFCIFTSFALLDKKESFEILGEMFAARTGIKMSGEELVAQANGCIIQEKEFNEQRWMSAQKKNIPPFTKVLYRYFDQEK